MTVYRHPSDIAGAHRLGIAVARAVLQGDGEADRLLAAMTRSEVDRAIKALSLDLADTAGHKPSNPATRSTAWHCRPTARRSRCACTWSTSPASTA